MTRAELERASARLREAGRLIYVRGHWCREERPSDCRDTLTAAEVRELCGRALARTVCRPGTIALEPTGKELS